MVNSLLRPMTSIVLQVALYVALWYDGGIVVKTELVAFAQLLFR